MSQLSEQVAAQHALNPHDGGCSCGKWTYDAWTLRWEIDIAGHLRHVADVTEKAVREAIAAQLENLEHTRPQTTLLVRNGVTVDWIDGYDHATRVAALTAREGTTPA